MKRIFVFLLTCVTVAALAACGPGAPASESPTPEASTVAPTSAEASASPTASPSAELFAFTSENMPRIDGSTATIPLISAVRSVLLGIAREDDVTVSGTDNAYVNLIDGGADVLLVYEPSPDTLDYAEGQGVELEMAPIGKDALVFLVNVKNPVLSLTEEQLVDIYSGKITNWKDVGGQDGEIRAYQRQLLSGSQTMMNKLVMKGTPMAEAPADYVIGEMGTLVDAVAVYDGAENAIGYNVYFYVSRMKLDKTSACCR
jgi:phosphate transport system substrate-binding protein